MKRCSLCGVLKPYSEFHKRYGRDGYQPWCKPCRKEYDHEYWKRNRTRWALNKAASGEKRRLWLRELKLGRPCADCGGSFPPEAMQWDHLPGTEKLGEISGRVGHRKTKLVLEELAKCELVCANCHAIRTAKRIRDRFGV